VGMSLWLVIKVQVAHPERKNCCACGGRRGFMRTIELMAPTMFKRNRNYLERNVHHVHESLTFSPAEGWRKWGIEHLENHA